MVLFWVFCFILGFILLKKLYPHFSEECQEDTIDKPVEILKSRYANGEIERTEFLEKKKDIEE